MYRRNILLSFLALISVTAIFAWGPGELHAAGLTPGVTSVREVVNSSGVFVSAITIKSDDTRVQLYIDQGTVGLVNGGPLSQISILPLTSPPSPPAYGNAVTSTYDLGPEGAVFNPSITLIMTYDPALLPAGVNESKLVIAKWDGTKWVNLNSTVNTSTDTISAPLSGFSKYAIFAYTRPASFAVSSLNISPIEVNSGQPVSVSVVVTNNGDVGGSYSVTFAINGVTADTKNITLAGGSSQTVAFNISKDVPGTYNVTAGGLSGVFTVKPTAAQAPAKFIFSGLAISPSSLNVGDKATITVNLNNTGDLSGTYTVILKINGAIVDTQDVSLAGKASQQVRFVQTQNTAGTFTVNIGDQSGTFTVGAPKSGTSPVAPKETSWTPIIGIVAGIIVIVAIVLIVIRRHRAQIVSNK